MFELYASTQEGGSPKVPANFRRAVKSSQCFVAREIKHLLRSAERQRPKQVCSVPVRSRDVNNGGTNTTIPQDGQRQKLQRLRNFPRFRKEDSPTGSRQRETESFSTDRQAFAGDKSLTRRDLRKSVFPPKCPQETQMGWRGHIHPVRGIEIPSVFYNKLNFFILL